VPIHRKKTQITAMTQNSPTPPLPDSSPDHKMDTNFLDGAFDFMLLNPQIMSPDDFDDNLSTAEAEDNLQRPASTTQG
jgi:hypothetical protein